MAGHVFGCGQCMPCRFNKRREWTHRLMLEANLHSDSAFVTLTYRFTEMNENGQPVVVPKHTQDWLKRLRKEIYPRKVRYFLVGEYGSETQRPHYHVALFGYPSCSRGFTTYSRGGDEPNCCLHCKLIHRTWKLGRVAVGSLERESAQYIAGYTTKKMTQADDVRLEGRHPEFARMSLRPGIGADFVPHIAQAMVHHALEQSEGDVPVTLRHGMKELPLGRYLRKKLRAEIGRPEQAPKEVQLARSRELHPLLARSEANKTSLAQEVKKEAEGRYARFEARRKIFKKGEIL